MGHLVDFEEHRTSTTASTAELFFYVAIWEFSSANASLWILIPVRIAIIGAAANVQLHGIGEIVESRFRGRSASSRVEASENGGPAAELKSAHVLSGGGHAV